MTLESQDNNYERDYSHSHCYDTQEGHEKHLRCCICTKDNPHLQDNKTADCKGCNYEAEYSNAWQWHTCGKEVRSIVEHTDKCSYAGEPADPVLTCDCSGEQFPPKVKDWIGGSPIIEKPDTVEAGHAATDWIGTAGGGGVGGVLREGIEKVTIYAESPTTDNLVEDAILEFEDSYKGILPPESIKRGSDWYRTKLNFVIARTREEIEEKAQLFGDTRYSEGKEQGASEERERISNNPAFAALKTQMQMDEDGTFVGVSRQALDEIMAIIESDSTL